jgi:ribosome silencing factor RsfS/YbeB/iojap
MAPVPRLQMMTADTAPHVVPLLTTAQKLHLIQDCLAAGQADEIVTIDLHRQNAFADAIIIASGQSQRQLTAIADRLDEAFRQHGERLHMEGRNTSDWVLIDAGEIIVHLFRPDMRKLYNLEKMWGMGSGSV